jgi:hypothetical protein
MSDHMFTWVDRVLKSSAAELLKGHHEELPCWSCHSADCTYANSENFQAKMIKMMGYYKSDVFLFGSPWSVSIRKTLWIGKVLTCQLHSIQVG